MKLTSIHIIDDFLESPDDYVKEVLLGSFTDVMTDVGLFKNIQECKNDVVTNKVKELFKGYNINLNFIRKSPFKQKEPNYIHSDEMMGDLTCLLYLNKEHPNKAGTRFYDNDKKTESIEVRMKYNRMLVFPSFVFHSRNLFENFGQDMDSRLVQVLFISKK